MIRLGVAVTVTVSCRKKGFNRSSAVSEFEKFIKPEDHCPLLQKEIKQFSEEYEPACWKSGMCSSHPLKRCHAALHNYMFKMIRSSLATSFGEKAHKDVLLSGDVIFQVCWKELQSQSDFDRDPDAANVGAWGPSGSADIPKPAEPAEPTIHHRVKYFQAAPRPF